MEKKFRIFSIILIIECFLIYGFRFGYYYLKFNNKKENKPVEKELLVNKLKKHVVDSNDGLYKNEDELVYRGSNVDNYLVYSNLVWRIVKVNKDNSITLVLDSKITDLPFGSDEISESYIYKYLNLDGDNTGIFESKLNNKEKYLVPNSVCLDTVLDINNLTCYRKEETKYIGLLSVADFINSKNTDSYLKNTDDFWLNNKTDEDKVYYVSKGNLSTDTDDSFHGIKPIITLNNKTEYISGDGSLKNPFVIEKDVDNLGINSYVKLDNDLYTVYDIEDKVIRLVSDELVNDSRARYNNYYNVSFNPDLASSIAYYLNNTYYNSLSYKDKLVDCDYYTGELTTDYDYSTKEYIKNYDYKNIYKTKVSAKVGLLSITDINLNSSLDNYFLLNKVDGIVKSVNKNNATTTNKMRPTICIDKNTKLKGNGTKENPFSLEETNEN